MGWATVGPGLSIQFLHPLGKHLVLPFKAGDQQLLLRHDVVELADGVLKVSHVGFKLG